jgi:ribonuclease HI
MYMDKVCINNGKANAKCGSRVWFRPNNPRNQAIKVPGETQLNQAKELMAMIVAIQETPIYIPLNIIMDSKYVIQGLIEHLYI